MGKQELSRPFRGESGGAYLRPKALLFVHCKENRRRLAVRLDKKDGQTWHVPRVVLTTYCLGVGLRSLHFLRVPSLHWPYVLKGGPMDFGRGIFRASFAKLSRTFRKNSVPNPGKAKSWQTVVLLIGPPFQPPPRGCLPSNESCQNLPVTFRNMPCSCSFIAAYMNKRDKYHTSLHVSFRDFRGALLLSRSFAKQHFPFARAPQINSHIKVNVVGLFRCSFKVWTQKFRNQSFSQDALHWHQSLKQVITSKRRKNGSSYIIGIDFNDLQFHKAKSPKINQAGFLSAAQRMYSNSESKSWTTKFKDWKVSWVWSNIGSV